MDVLTQLQTRVSRPLLTAPGPTSEQYNDLIKAALRAPDHAQLRPYRFIKVTGDQRLKLGQLLLTAALKQNPELPEAQQEKLKKAPLRAPDLLLPILCPQEHPKVPEQEQLLSLGAAVGNLLNAASVMGVGAMWRSGLVSYEPSLAEGLGLKPHEKLYGFIYLGTPAGKPKPVPQNKVEDFLSEW